LLTASDESILKQRLRARAREGGRSDDADESVIEHRFAAFHERHDRVLACYHRRQIVRIDALLPPMQVARHVFDSVADFDPLAATGKSSTEFGPALDAVITDMDGVLTRTTRLHEPAWNRTSDAVLEQYEGQRPFSRADCEIHVDGKPVDVHEDTTAALARWRRGGLKLACVSASGNCRSVLDAAGLEQCFGAIVDVKSVAELGLDGKKGILLEAARRLGVAPERTVVFEDANAGVRAAREAGFGVVIGVAREDVAKETRLLVSGADAVVSDVSRARFRRRVPHVSSRIEELSALRGDRALAVLLDYDGTLTPIVDHPDDARLSDETRTVLEQLAAKCVVAILSGRDREDVAARVGIRSLFYAGNHGFDIAGPGVAKTLPEAQQALGNVDRAEEELRRLVEKHNGVIIERKRFSVAAHFRQVVSRANVREIEKAVDSVRAATGLRKRTGKQVLELEPAVAWDKGRALQWLVDTVPNLGEETFVVYIGDDETDEDAFAALQGRGAGVRVGSKVTTSLADYTATRPADVQNLLGLWAGSR